MKRTALLLILCSIILPLASMAGGYTNIPSSSLLSVALEAPATPLRMGNTPIFTGKVTNHSTETFKNLVVYLSLVSLQPGREHPVDLEDWSAQKAIRLDHLAPGQTAVQRWKMRLIKSGPFGAALTIVNPVSDQPHISPLVLFDIAPKPTVLAGRIFPVALGIPLLLAGLFLFIWRTRR